MPHPTHEPPQVPRDTTSFRRWLVGPAVLDEGSMELTVSGRHIELERKPLEVLLHLMRHAGEVVTKDELAESLWPGRILTETVLARCISLLRQALGDEQRTLIRTVHGYGYRLVADVRVEASLVPAPAAFDFHAGDSPPGRPQWKLSERLGTGGRGEAWLARHEKTGEARVFKFAVDRPALSSLKREITLYRLLHDTLGDQAPVVRILEWNLEEPPYFVEEEHVEEQSLDVWARKLGGLSSLPLAERLNLAITISDAVATVHSAGVVHKDLKPGNILVCNGRTLPVAIKLADFGSGAILDPLRLEKLGITRLGFTATATDHSSGGTAMYIAPEVLAGQPFTIKSDIYSLGIILYQIVAGDLHRALTAGWEMDVQDELLREDIAAAAAGNPARRLADAADLAGRLRTLRQRHERLAAERQAHARAEQARQILQDLKRTRVAAALLLVFAATALGSGMYAYKARNRAVAAAETSKAVNDFLMNDVLWIDPLAERSVDATYGSLLERAASRVDIRFASQPDAAANIHFMLGRRYSDLGQMREAALQFDRAATLFEQVSGLGSAMTIISLEHLAWALALHGDIEKANGLAGKLARHLAGTHSQGPYFLLALRWRLAICSVLLGHHEEATEGLRAVLREIPHTPAPDPETAMLLKKWMGVPPSQDVSLPELLSAVAGGHLGGLLLAEYWADYLEAEKVLTDSLEKLLRQVSSNSIEVARAHTALGFTKAMLGKYDEAELLLSRARDSAQVWQRAGDFRRSIPVFAYARLMLEQGRSAEALEYLQEALAQCPAQSGCPDKVRAILSYETGRAYQQQRRREDAIAMFRAALRASEKAPSTRRIVAFRVRVSLADALREAGRLLEANSVLLETDPLRFAVPRQHEAFGDLRRVQGLLWLTEGKRQEAEQAFHEAREIAELRFGPKHWRTERARRELALAQATPH